MKAIEVVAAVIINGDKILATQRSYGEFKDGWEFPGGKLEKAETKEEAIIREIKEELDADIIVKQYLTTAEYDYPSFHLTMHCFLCELVSGEIRLVEHKAAKWLSREQLDSVEWLPADYNIIEILKENYDKNIIV